MPDDSAFKGGMESTRLPSDLLLDEANRRVEQCRQARGNLAALVVEEHGGLTECRRSKAARTAAAAAFADLADMLGLAAAPDRVPGLCRSCGRPLPASVAARALTGPGRRDVCARRACREVSGG